MAQQNLEESLGYLIGQTRRVMVNCITGELEKAQHDVTCEQGAILMNLWQKNGQSQKELAQCVCKDKTSVTRLIDGMEKRSLVVRKANNRDGRQKLIYLTQKGKHLRQEFLKIINKILENGQKGINKENLETCKMVLKQVVQNLS